VNDREWLAAAIDHSRACTPIPTAYCVGAIVVAADGTEIARGYSRETDPTAHAEEVALRRIPPDDPRLTGATVFSSLEPCGVRASRPLPCARLIAATPVGRVVYALREPPLLAAGGGTEILHAAGLEVVELGDLAQEVYAVNAHLLRTER
jgi:diaminohydroxyphosphoribosylaminopyrimidine deaminase / 5-amino-6-(5-phosphoribosylamino)uracil reductase